MIRGGRGGGRRIRPAVVRKTWMDFIDRFVCKFRGRTMLKVITFLKEMLPALCSSMRVLYTSLGLLPVGRPSTKGFSDVKAWVLIRSTDVSSTSVFRNNT